MSIPPLRTRAAFTLTELVVVIAVIAVLASLLLPTITMVRASARTVTCSNNQHQIHVALVYWAQEHRGLLPHSSHIYDSSTWGAVITLATGKPIADSSMMANEGLLSVQSFVCPEAAANRKATLQSWPYPRCFDYAAAYCYTGMYGITGGMGQMWQGGPVSRFPGNGPPSKAILTIDRLYFVNYTDPNTINGQHQVSSTLNHGFGKRAVASYVDGHVTTVTPTLSGPHAKWPARWGWVASNESYHNGLATGE